MLAVALLLAIQQPALSEAGTPSGFDPLPSTAEEVEAAFPMAWKLPRLDLKSVALPCQRFEAQLLGLVREPLAAIDAQGSALMLGDLLARATAAARLPSVDAARKEVVALLADARARVPASLWPQVEPLLDLREFLSPKWDPDADKRSGFLMGESWELPEDCWPAKGGKRNVEQCAVFMAADLASIKIAEANFPSYFNYSRNNYLHVAAVPNSYRVELAPDRALAAGLACATRTAIAMDFESDLPFPFSTYACRLRLLTETNADGRAITWIHSDSPDFYWLAGYDLYEPVHDAAGAFVGLLVIRQFGCDLDGVPDGRSDHRGGMRMVLGGVKRLAESLWRERAADGPFPLTGAVPVPPVVPGKSR
ncbi:MAG: hypothetical protein O3A20_00255 [Planctomycetota bacterium]|nr:hypothetical protein [Planctomycetota bacterium]